MNKVEYDLFQSKVKESGRTQQEVVIKAIADLKIASTQFHPGNFLLSESQNFHLLLSLPGQ